ncbi:MAG: caspase family protein [Elusimicrobia bacterium]|nr:caspase family protein [Elusimicrobiota bacterium]
MRLVGLCALAAVLAWGLQGCATAPGRSRGTGTHRVIDASPEEARQALHRVFGKMGEGFTVSDQEDLVQAVYDNSTQGVRVRLAYKAFLSPGPNGGQTDVEMLCEIPFSRPDALRKCESNFLGHLPDAVDLARLRRQAPSGGGERPPSRDGGPRPAADDVDSPSYRVPERPQDFAVVVGIEDYSSLPAARFAARDAQAVAAHLKALGWPQRNIALLTGVQATKTGLAKHLEAWLPNNAGEQSTVFFYYSGHGAPQPETGEAYLVPFDGDPEYLAETGYPLQRLYERLGALKAKRVIVALDSCFSGAGGRSVLAQGTRPLVNKVDVGSLSGSKVVSLSASQASQISGTAEDERHGLFTYYLLQGLNGAARDQNGGVTVTSLFDYLAPKVADQARRSNRSQNPRMLPAAGSATGQWRLR